MTNKKATQLPKTVVHREPVATSKVVKAAQKASRDKVESSAPRTVAQAKSVPVSSTLNPRTPRNPQMRNAPPKPSATKPAVPVKLGKTVSAAEAQDEVGEDGVPPVVVSRADLIRSRHDVMKREIDQIREDLDSDEDD